MSFIDKFEIFSDLRLSAYITTIKTGKDQP